jgi:hypothetical protein
VTQRHEIARAGILVEPAHDHHDCRCLKRRTQQAGEVHCERTARTAEIPLPPVVPLTGFLPRPSAAAAAVAPKVIVSHLLAGASVEVMVFPDPAHESRSVENPSIRKRRSGSRNSIHLLAMEDFGFAD